jgi:hypothetical protein
VLRRLAHPTARVFLTMILVASWMMLLFTGHAAGGAVQALFVAALVVFPWRSALV